MKPKVYGNPIIFLDPFKVIKTIFLFSLLFLSGCASVKYSDNDVTFFNINSNPSLERPEYFIKRNESYSEWSNRQPDQQKDTYIGSGINPASQTIPVSFPWGRTGWGLRPFDYNF